MKSYDIIQIPHAYSFVIGFYGVCNGNSDVGCVDYDMKLSDFRNVVDSVYEVDSSQNNTTFSWYKSDLYKTDLNHFDKLECGKAYYFVVKSGVGRVNIPHLYVSNSGTHNANARVTTDCDFIQTTPVTTTATTPTTSEEPTDVYSKLVEMAYVTLEGRKLTKGK